MRDEGHPEYQFKVEKTVEDYQRQFFEETIDNSLDSAEDENETKEEIVAENEAANENEVSESEANVLDALEKDEEHSRTNDPTIKDNFDYNKVTCYVNDHPEASVPDPDKPVSIAPGEGNNN